VIRVVLVLEEDGWRAYFSTDRDMSAVRILELAADRGALEETFKDVKEIWGAGQQQLRNYWANVGAFNLNAWMYSAVELWSWQGSHEELVDRRASPWDEVERRPSHADKRVALRREVLRAEIRACKYFCVRAAGNRFCFSTIKVLGHSILEQDGEMVQGCFPAHDRHRPTL
jgi:hypothetical protein